MKCKCGGELIRIAVDCYQCNLCGLKQAIAFLSIPIEININLNNGFNTNADNNYMKQIEENILKAKMIPKRYLGK